MCKDLDKSWKRSYVFFWKVKREHVTASSGSEHHILAFHVSFLKMKRCAMTLKK
jgi:hypothetical protein